MTNTLINSATNNEHNPLEAARFLSAFIECSREVQELGLEMVAIILDESSTNDERELASDALMECLFPGMATDIQAKYRAALDLPEGRQAAAELDAQQATFSERVRAKMREQGLTQEELAEMLGVGQPAVSNILNRHARPQSKTIDKFAEVLGVTREELWPELDSER